MSTYSPISKKPGILFVHSIAWWLFFIAGIISLVFIIIVFVYSGINIYFPSHASGESLNRPTSYQGSGILTVIIISLTTIAILTSILAFSATVGLNSAVKKIKDDLEDEIYNSTLDTVTKYSSLGGDEARASIYLDLSMIEWKSSLLADTNLKREESLLRAFTMANLCLDRVYFSFDQLRNLPKGGNYQLESEFNLELLRAIAQNNFAYFVGLIVYFQNSGQVKASKIFSGHEDEIKSKALQYANEAYKTIIKKEIYQIDRLQHRWLSFYDTYLFLRFQLGIYEYKADLKKEVLYLLSEARKNDMQVWANKIQTKYESILF